MKWMLLGLIIGLQLTALQQWNNALGTIVKMNDISAVLLGNSWLFTENKLRLMEGIEQLKEIESPTGAKHENYQTTPHLIDLKRWRIHNDGTRPVETTQGINAALKWANKSGITATTLPAGTYLIDKDSRINMVGNMLFDLPGNVTLQKETNGKELYHLLYIGHEANNVTIRGGVYKGDKDKHNYSKKDHKHSSGTHEGGYGIILEGAESVTIEGVKSTHFTGDGLMVGGYGTAIHGLYEKSFESGEFNGQGKPVVNKGKIRTSRLLSLDHPILKKERRFELSNPVNLPGEFDVYFFNKSGKLVQTLTGVKVRDEMSIPDEAVGVHLVFAKSNSKEAHIQVWSRILSKNILVQNSEFGYNRRQGITVGGAEQVIIKNNELHHMKGTMPQSGIDVEGGFHYNGFANRNIIISDNRFHNNASYDVILFDGENAVVKNNHMASKGAIGLAISTPFEGAYVENNLFEGASINANRSALFKNNRMIGSRAVFHGPGVEVNGMELVDSVLHISATEAFGVTASKITIKSEDNTLDSGLSLAGKPVRLEHITISGESKLRTVTGNVEPGSIINFLKVKDYNSKYGLSLPPANYNYCEFSGAEGEKSGMIGVSNAGRYVFNKCKFTFSSTAKDGILATNPKLDLTIKNSIFEVLGNTHAIGINSVANVLLEDNTIVAEKLTDENTIMIRLNEKGKSKEKNDIVKAIIRRNEITTNLAVIGISTINAGFGAPAYSVHDNLLVKAKLALKENDDTSNNSLK